MLLHLPKLSKELGLEEPGPSCNQEKVSRDISHKTFQTNYRLHVKQHTTGKL